MQVQGKLNLAKMTLNTTEHSLSLHYSGSVATTEPSSLFCKLPYRSERGRHASILIDEFSSESPNTWLKESRVTVWLLNIAIGRGDEDNRVLGNGLRNRQPGLWLPSGNFYTGRAPTRYYDSGLVLFHSKDILVAVAKLQKELKCMEYSRCQALRSTYSRMEILDRPSTRHYAGSTITKWMRGNEPMEANKIIGPHNATYQ